MSDDDLDKEITALLKRAEQRYTRGRRALVAALRDAGQPVTIHQILDKDDGLAQSSAYRNLVVLEEAGVVTRIVTNDEFARYELAERLTEHHHHLICSSCGDVIDFSLAARTEASLDRALHRVADDAGFTVESHRLDLVGTCAGCD
ncbi:MAG: Fur family transcriptional regulator [Acidimicrobiales bacterium]|nr:Fur family transcriptional regulator [Acidimicrobiales bacterium]